jgi:hypothetical protein
MSEVLKDFMKSGKTLIIDTKSPRKTLKPTKKASLSAVEDCPHAVFVRRVIQEKPKPKELLKDIKRFIESAEAEL